MYIFPIRRQQQITKSGVLGYEVLLVVNKVLKEPVTLRMEAASSIAVTTYETAMS